MRGGRPTVTLKLATSLDGQIALADGRSQWITGEDARAEVHAMRARHDVMLTGVGTVLADNPQLTARPGGVLAPSQPRRAVMDSRARTPADSAFVKAGPAIILHTRETPPPALVETGVDLVRVAPDEHGRASLLDALIWLGQTGAESVMIEAGGSLASRAVMADVVDRIEWFRAPILLGGDGRPSIAALGLESLDHPPTFRCRQRRECGRDLWESWERA